MATSRFAFSQGNHARPCFHRGPFRNSFDYFTELSILNQGMMSVSDKGVIRSKSSISSYPSGISPSLCSTISP